MERILVDLLHQLPLRRHWLVREWCLHRLVENLGHLIGTLPLHFQIELLKTLSVLLIPWNNQHTLRWCSKVDCERGVFCLFQGCWSGHCEGLDWKWMDRYWRLAEWCISVWSWYWRWIDELSEDEMINDVVVVVMGCWWSEVRLQKFVVSYHDYW